MAMYIIFNKLCCLCQHSIVYKNIPSQYVCCLLFVGGDALGVYFLYALKVAEFRGAHTLF